LRRRTATTSRRLTTPSGASATWCSTARISPVSKTNITERVIFEFRAEFLNAFNNVNFIVGNANNDTNVIGGHGSPTFAQLSSAYRDLSTTNDPGGRLIQLVARINF